MTHQRLRLLLVLLQLIVVAVSQSAIAAEKLVGIHSVRVLSQFMPWIAQEAGLFRKHKLEVPVVFIASSPAVTALCSAAMLKLDLPAAKG